MSILHKAIIACAALGGISIGIYATYSRGSSNDEPEKVMEEVKDVVELEEELELEEEERELNSDESSPGDATPTQEKSVPDVKEKTAKEDTDSQVVNETLDKAQEINTASQRSNDIKLELPTPNKEVKLKVPEGVPVISNKANPNKGGRGNRRSNPQIDRKNIEQILSNISNGDKNPEQTAELFQQLLGRNKR